MPSASAFEFAVDLRRPGFVGGAPGIVEALVRLQAPPRPAGSDLAQPVTLAIVVDRSASMAGSALAAAKEAARTVVQGLGPRDRALLIAFDADARVLCPLVPAARRSDLLAAIETIDVGRGSDLYGGWLAGARLLGQHVRDGGTCRVIVLSDGHANQGETRFENIARSCRDAAGQGITTSTYGVGRSKETLMLAMAANGQGRAHQCADGEGVTTSLRAELARLSELCARDLVLKVDVPTGVQVTLRNDYEPIEAAGTGWKLPDLAYGAEAWAYLKLTVPSVFLMDAVVDLPVTLTLKATGAPGAPLFFMAPLPTLQRMTRQALMMAPPDERVQRRREELAAREGLALVRRLLARGHGHAAEIHVRKAREQFAANARCTKVLDHMQRLVAEHRRAALPTLHAERRSAERDARATGRMRVPGFLLRGQMAAKPGL